MGLSALTKPLLVVVCGVLALATGFAHFVFNVDNFRARKVEEKATVLELTSVFVSRYSDIRKSLSDATSQVTARLRAHPFEEFNGSRKGGRIVNVRMVGVPGRAIKIEPAEAQPRRIISGMAGQPNPKSWTNFVGARGREIFRTIRPVIAGEDACVSCHNSIQNGGPQWRLGEVMGAYVLDVPAAAFLAGLRKQSTILGILVFIAVLGGAMILMRLQHHISGMRLEAERAKDQEAVEAEARRQAEELATARQEAEAKSRQLADLLVGKNTELAHVNSALEQKLNELQQAQNELVKKGKLAQLGQLTATVAHEIRNPLGAVRTSSFIIERKTKDLGLGLDKPMARIKNGVARCDQIIAELLDFARTRSVELKTKHVDTWLEDIVSEQAADLPVEVAVECRLGLGETQTGFDAHQMQRVIINLISNSAEAMVGKAGKPLDNPIENPRIVISSRLTQRGIEILVADNGPGICEADMKRILEPLFTTKSFGVGLGLPAVEKILQEHGGGLDVDGGKGHGATFTAWFPMRNSMDAAA